MFRSSENDAKPNVTSLFQDSVFATLMDMFGDTLSADAIRGVGTTRQWNRKFKQPLNCCYYILCIVVDACIEQLIHLTDSKELARNPDQTNHMTDNMNELRISYQGSVENGEFSDDADVLIESEEVQSDLLQPYEKPEPVPPQRPQPCSGTIPKTTNKLIQPSIQNSMN